MSETVICRFINPQRCTYYVSWGLIGAYAKEKLHVFHFETSSRMNSIDNPYDPAEEHSWLYDRGTRILVGANKGWMDTLIPWS